MAKVLVVEDEETIARLIQVDLQLAGYDVTIAPNGAQALEAFPKVSPEVVILDWMMPDMSGIEVLREFKTRGWRSSTKVVMVTARVQERDIMKGWRQGVDAYLTKPFDMDVLKDTIADVLNASAATLAERRDAELRRAGLLRALDDLLDES